MWDARPLALVGLKSFAQSITSFPWKLTFRIKNQVGICQSQTQVDFPTEWPLFQFIAAMFSLFVHTNYDQQWMWPPTSRLAQGCGHGAHNHNTGQIQWGFLWPAIPFALGWIYGWPRIAILSQRNVSDIFGGPGIMWWQVVNPWRRSSWRMWYHDEVNTVESSRVGSVGRWAQCQCHPYCCYLSFI